MDRSFQLVRDGSLLSQFTLFPEWVQYTFPFCLIVILVVSMYFNWYNNLYSPKSYKNYYIFSLTKVVLPLLYITGVGFLIHKGGGVHVSV